jgi:hypothetical protein
MSDLYQRDTHVHTQTIGRDFGSMIQEVNCVSTRAEHTWDLIQRLISETYPGNGSTATKGGA